MTRLIAALAFALALFIQPADAQSPLTPVQFRDATIAAVLELNPDIVVHVENDLSFTVRRPDGSEQQVNLDYGYQRYVADPSALEPILDRWSRLAAQGPEFAQMPERIVAILRPRQFVDDYQAAIDRAPPEHRSRLVSRPFAGDLLEVLVFDSAETVEYVTERALRDIGVTPEQAWALAPQNLPQRIGEMHISDIGYGGALISSSNGLGPSALTMPEACSGPDALHYVFIVVERDAYLRIDRRGAIAQRGVSGFRDQLVREESILSGSMLECRNGRVQAIEEAPARRRTMR